jgi:hypothetical protein
MWDFVIDKSGAGAGFLRELRFPPVNLHSICFSTIIFTITRGWHNRPGVAAVPIASQYRIKKKMAVGGRLLHTLVYIFCLLVNEIHNNCIHRTEHKVNMLEKFYGCITVKHYLNIHQRLLSLLRKLNFYFTGYVIFFFIKMFPYFVN